MDLINCASGKPWDGQGYLIPQRAACVSDCYRDTVTEKHYERVHNLATAKYLQQDTLVNDQVFDVLIQPCAKCLTGSHGISECPMETGAN